MRYATINASAMDYLHRILASKSEEAARIFHSPVICIGRDKAVTGALLARLAKKIKAKHRAQVEARVRRNHVDSLLGRA